MIFIRALIFLAGLLAILGAALFAIYKPGGQAVFVLLGMLLFAVLFWRMPYSLNDNKYRILIHVICLVLSLLALYLSFGLLASLTISC